MVDTDTAKAIELLRQHEVAGTWVERKTQSALVEVFAAAVEFRAADRAFFGTQGPRGTAKRLKTAGLALDAAIANLTKGVLGDG